MTLHGTPRRCWSKGRGELASQRRLLQREPCNIHLTRPSAIGSPSDGILNGRGAVRHRIRECRGKEMSVTAEQHETLRIDPDLLRAAGGDATAGRRLAAMARADAGLSSSRHRTGPDRVAERPQTGLENPGR